MEEIEKAANEIINDGTTLGYFDTFAKYEKTGFIKGAKWQEKRMYSEEELERAYDLGVEQCIKRGCVYVRAMNDWDDIKQQFKKQ
jgi:cytosine/adenosine deaminase-related metal-dependent hydrolase